MHAFHLRTRGHWRAWLILSLLILTLMGCRATPPRTQPLDTPWGRGLWVGTGQLHEAPALLVDAQGERVQLVWGSKQQGKIDLHLAQMTSHAGVVSSMDLDTGLFLPRHYRLFPLATGDTLLLTLARPHKDGVPGVFLVRLSPQGTPQTPPQRITPADAHVVNYDAAMRSDESLDLVWEALSPDEDGRGLFYHRLRGLTATPSAENLPRFLAQGQSPSLFRDGRGRLHLLWHLDRTSVGDREILYARLNEAPEGPVAGVPIYRHGRNPGLRLSAPALTGDDEHLYAFWHLERLSGLGAGTASVTVVTFPMVQPAQASAFDIVIPEVLPNPDAWRAGGDVIPISETTQARTSGYVFDPRALYFPSPTDHAVLLMSAKLTYRMKSRLQPVMVRLQNGRQVGYAPIARSRFISTRPVGTGDLAGNLYAAWLDYRDTGTYLVLFSSTSPVWKQGALQLSLGDMLEDVLSELGFGLLATSALIPMLLFIFLIPLTLLGLLALSGRDRKLDTRTGRFQLLVAVGCYYLGKIVAFSSALTRPTLIRTLPSPWAEILLPLIPLLIFLAAMGVMLFYIRRADHPGPITSFFLFALVDLLLTSIIYAPAFYP